MKHIVWTGKEEGVDYRVERYWLDKGKGRQFWYLLVNSGWTYLCTKGPFTSEEERDDHILTEVEERK
jgi:hypothetical protein